MTKPPFKRSFPHLWYVREAEEAARFYATVFPDSRVDRVTTLAAESPSGPAGSVAVVEFTLCGQAFMSISAGPHHSFNDAVSFLGRLRLAGRARSLLERAAEEWRQAAGLRLDHRQVRPPLADRADGARRDDDRQGPGESEASGRGDAAASEIRHREARGCVQRPLARAAPLARSSRDAMTRSSGVRPALRSAARRAPASRAAPRLRLTRPRFARGRRTRAARRTRRCTASSTRRRARRVGARPSARQSSRKRCAISSLCFLITALAG